MRKLLVASAAVLAMVTGATQVSAATIAFSNTPFFGGSGGTVLTGNAGVIGDITITKAVIDTAVNLDTNVASLVTNPAGTGCGTAGSYGCMSLTSGAFQGVGSNPHQWLYSGVGSSLTITGNAQGGGPALYTGQFDPSENIVLAFDTNGSGQFTGTGTISGTLKDGTLDPLLAAFLGVPTQPDGGTSSSSFFNFKFTVGGEPNGSGTMNNNSVQLVFGTVPEPGSLMLFGMGLAAAARLSMRRKN